MSSKDGDKYDVLEKIGQGSFGVIRKVRRKDNGQILCRKEILYSRMSEKEKEQLYAELKILESLKHPSIVQYCHREHIKACNELHLYMEYCGNGDLGGYIKKLKERSQYADEDFIWSIFAQLVGALYRCHYGEDPPSPGEEGVVKRGKALQTKEGYRVILHRDLKPENVFLSKNNAVKLGDFGLSKIIAAHDFASTYVGTPYYMSPEICAAERYSHHSDVWSLGCIIYELATRCVPFEAKTQIELVMKIKTGRIKPLPTAFSQDLTDIISWCLKVDPRNRPDAAQLLNVTQIKLARARLEQSSSLGIIKGDLLRAQQERDSLLVKLQSSQKQNQDLQTEVSRLKEAGKKIEMEWHARATLAIDQRVSEEVDRLRGDMEQQLATLRRQDEAQLELRVQEELRLHYASLPSSHGASDSTSAALHVRSSTPPPHQPTSSFTTVATGATSDNSSGSSLSDDHALDTDLSSLSVMEQELGDNVSPLAQRTKPFQKARQPLSRARTLAHCHFSSEPLDSPMDVHMADPSPMVSHIKGLSLSPRRSGFERPASSTRGRNIFSMAAEQRLRPAIGNEVTSFADDELLEDDEIELGNSPSRPSNGLLGQARGDPFKALPAPKLAPMKRPRPSLGRQQTMPVNLPQPAPHQRTKSINVPSRISANNKSEKENRPPSADSGRAPLFAASPKRVVVAKDGRILTPSRKAPPPPTHSGGFARNVNKQNGLSNSSGGALQTPARIKGRTLIELQQARLDPSHSDSEIMSGMPKLVPSPAKWDPTVEDMPSPFLARKGRLVAN